MKTDRQKLGQGLVEYILLLLFLVSAIIGTLLALGGQTRQLPSRAVNVFRGRTPTPEVQETPIVQDIQVQVVDAAGQGSSLRVYPSACIAPPGWHVD